MADNIDQIKNIFYGEIKFLQSEIISRMSELDPQLEWDKEPWVWTGADGVEGGGGLTCYGKGDLFESAGVNISRIDGKMDPQFMERIRPGAESLFATGISLIIHPRSPKVPTVHANFRLIHVKGGDVSSKHPSYWFGGGADLTPYYPFEEDFHAFHQEWKKALHDYDLYPTMKRTCDQYFTNHHRQFPEEQRKAFHTDCEMRGIGGIFYDHFNSGDFGRDHQMVQKIMQHFIPSYFPIVEKRKDLSWDPEDEDFQLHRRGRYVEFNLIHDRGTHFGLKSKGRTESILVSLPPRCTFSYKTKWRPGSPQEKMMSFYRPMDW